MHIKDFIIKFINLTSRHNTFGRCAEIAYYIFISLFPFLIGLSTVISVLNINISAFILKANELLPGSLFEVVAQNLEIISKNNYKFTSVGSIISSAIGLYIASKGVRTIIRGLDSQKDEAVKRPFFKTHALSIILTIILIFSASTASILILFGSDIVLLLTGGRQSAILKICSLSFSFIILILFFMLIYKAVEFNKKPLKTVAYGSLFGALGWVIATFGFAYYLDKFKDYSAVYGTAASVVIILIWLYITAFFILIGGEINIYIDKICANPKTFLYKKNDR